MRLAEVSRVLLHKPIQMERKPTKESRRNEKSAHVPFLSFVAIL